MEKIIRSREICGRGITKHDIPVSAPCGTVCVCVAIRKNLNVTHACRRMLIQTHTFTQYKHNIPPL